MKEKIHQLKKQKNAVILAHYYAPAEIQEVADHVGDSFYLAKVAKACQENVIVFLWCGIHGRKRQDSKSREKGACAGSRCGLSYGPYG